MSLFCFFEFLIVWMVVVVGIKEFGYGSDKWVVVYDENFFVLGCYFFCDGEFVDVWVVIELDEGSDDGELSYDGNLKCLFVDLLVVEKGNIVNRFKSRR